MSDRKMKVTLSCGHILVMDISPQDAVTRKFGCVKCCKAEVKTIGVEYEPVDGSILAELKHVW